VAYKCPRCNQPVKTSVAVFRREEDKEGGYTVVYRSDKYSKPRDPYPGGVIPLFIRAAFSSYECKKCDKIEREEFPLKVRFKMMLASFGIILISILIVVVIGWALFAKKGY